MIKTETRLKAWGNSIGVILPKEELQEESLKVDDEVEIIVKKKTNTLKELFGKLNDFKPKVKKTTVDILREVDEELKSRFD